MEEPTTAPERMPSREEVRARLRAAAAAHEPDRARMLARVERGMTAKPRPARRPARPAPWLRAAGAALAVAAVLAAGGYTVTTLARPAGPAAPAAPAAGLRLTATGVIDPGSNRYWAQSDLTLTTPAPLTALTVELRIAQTGGVADTGNWRTLPAEDFTVSVREEPGRLVYRWTLRPGRTAPAGRHVFAAQYDHAEGARDPAADTYTVTATDGTARRGSAHGGFARHPEGPPR